MVFTPIISAAPTLNSLDLMSPALKESTHLILEMSQQPTESIIRAIGSVKPRNPPRDKGLKPTPNSRAQSIHDTIWRQALLSQGLRLACLVQLSAHTLDGKAHIKRCPKRSSPRTNGFESSFWRL